MRNIIAGYFIGEKDVAAVNMITPITGVVTFFANIVSIGSGILYSRHIGEMKKDRADEVYGQGMIITMMIAVISALFLLIGKGIYFKANDITGEFYSLASAYYKWTPINAFLTVVISYLNTMVYTDGDELCTNLSYGFQIGGNVIISVLLARNTSVHLLRI
ncbi:MAG: hypothetical protein IJ740_09965 [Ruminococcus sp.]|nr:hypothetical protein [Ruminococcus sp.]